MNKLFTKLAAGFIGLTMVASVGAVIGSKALEKEPVEANAASQQWELVSSALSDWSGEYILCNGNSNTVKYLEGSSFSSGSTTVSGKDVTIVDKTISVDDSNSIVIAKSSTQGKYTVMLNGIYIGRNANSNGIDSSNTWTSNLDNEISYSNNKIEIKGNGGRVLTWYGQNSNFRYYASSNNCSQLFKKIGSSKTATSIYALDPDANEIENGSSLVFDASSSTEYVVNAEVSYESGEDDSDYAITSSETTGLSIGDVDENGDCAITFSNNGIYHLSIASNATPTVKIDFTLTVSGITVDEYEKYTNAIVAGDYVLVSNNAYVLGNTIVSNRLTNGTMPTISSDKIVNPDKSIVWHIEKNGDYWSLRNAANSKYAAGTTSKNQAALLDECDTDLSKWTISVSEGAFEFENLGRSQASSDPANKYLRNNTTYGWACYASGTGKALTLYKKVSNDPYITVEASGVTDLSVGGTVTLTATLTNTSGTVTWAIQDSSNVVSKVDNGNSTTVTGCLDGTAYVVASFTGCENVSTKITVKKTLSSLAVLTEPDKTSYNEGESFDGTGMVLTATYDDGSTKTNITTSTSGVTWSPNGSLSTADVKVTITYAEEGYGSVSVDQAITVTGREIDSIAVTKMPNKTVYSQNEPLDTTGIVVTATYVGGSTADVTASCTFAPETLTVVGTQTITVTFGSKTTTFNVTVNEITGPIANGRYFIANTHTESEVEVTKVLSGAKISAKADPVQSDKTLSRAWNFTLVANNSYTISENIEGEVYYLYVINDNAGVRSKTCTENFPVWTIEINDNDFYTLSCSDGTQTRYLGAYNTGAYDFRSYKQLSAASTSFDIELIEEKDMYRDNFNNIFTEACDSQGIETDITALREAWPKAATQFATLSEDNRNIIATTEDELTARYDKIIERYSTYTEITNFMGRSVSPAGYMPNMIINSNSDNTVSIIVIVTLVGITSVGAFFYIRRRRQHN